MMKKLFALILTAVLLVGGIPLADMTLNTENLTALSGVSAPVAAAAGSGVMGDINGDKEVTAADARLVLRASVALEKLTSEQKTLADVDFDKDVSATDARLVLRASVGLEKLTSKTSTPKTPLTAKQIYQKATKYTVEVYVKGNGFASMGTGFVYSSDGKIVTNYHVIDGATAISVVTVDGKEYPCTGIIGYDANIDLAILQINAKGLTAAPTYEKYETGDDIYTLGSSEGLSFTIAEGIISNKQRELPSAGSGVQYIQISAPISHGNSGGPLIDAYGRVIGVNTLSLAEGQNLNFAIPVRYISQVLNKGNSSSGFYDQNNKDQSRVAFNSISSLLKKYGERSSNGDEFYSIMITDDTINENAVIVLSIAYGEDPSSELLPQFIELNYIVYPYDDNSAILSANVFITSDLLVFGQLAIDDRARNETYYSYSLIDPAQLTPYQPIPFDIANLPDDFVTEEDVQIAEKAFGTYISGAIVYAKAILEHFGCEYNVSDLGFVNF